MERNSGMERPTLDWLTPGRFAILIVTLLLAAFPKVLFGFETFYYRDYGVWGYPLAFHQHESFWRGELPLWNGLSNCGAPLLAQWGTMTLYPFSLIYLLFPLPWSLTWFCFGHLLLGSVGMYSLCWRWSENRAGAVLAGTAFVFNGLTFSCLIWPSYLVALGWMPWLVITAETAWKRGGRSIVVAAVVAALQLLAGAPEIAMLTWGLIGLLWIHFLLSHRVLAKGLPLPKGEGKGSVRFTSVSGLRATVRFTGVILLATGLAAVQLVPFLDLLTHSNRDASFLDARWPMPSWGWANFLVPLFHCFETFQGPFFQYGQEFFTSYYLGAGVLALAAWGAWKSANARIWILAGVVLLSVLMALGDNGFLFPLVKRFVPLVSIARYPVKFLMLAGFIVPLLAGAAMSRLEQNSPNDCPQGRTITSLLAAFCVAGLLIAGILQIAKAYPFSYDQWPATFRNGMIRLLFLGAFGTAIVLFARSAHVRTRSVLVFAGLMAIFADTLTHTAWQNPSLPTHVLAGGLWQAQDKAPAPKYGESRVFITPQGEEQLVRSTVRDPTAGLLGQRLALWSNLHLLDQIPKVNGSSTLQIREQKQLEKLLYQQTNALPSGFLDFLGASYMTSPENPTEWSVRTNFCAFITGGQNPEFVDQPTTLLKLMQSNFDPRQTVFLPPELQSTTHVTNSTDVRITNPSVSMNRLSFQSTAAQPAMCVIAQSFYHCWKPSIDGKPTKLLRANGAFQALIVPAGTHEVIISYRDDGLFAGIAITLLTIAVCIVLWRRKRADSASPRGLSKAQESVREETEALVG